MGEGHPYHHSAVQNCYHHALPTISSKISTDSTIADPFEGFTLDDIEAAKARLGERCLTTAPFIEMMQDWAMSDMSDPELDLTRT